MSVIQIAKLQKNYGALRPLRIADLKVEAGERVAVGGLDGPAAEVMVNLVTGATLPDEGTVQTFGSPTGAITDGDAWLASLERFGIVSPRAVLLEGSTLQQNLALPFTLELDPIPADIATRIAALASECGIGAEHLSLMGGAAPAHLRARTHLARALALNPELLLIEHPTADVDQAERPALARDFAAALEGRKAAALILTLDVDFAEGVAHRSLTLQPATGALVAWKAKRGWFR